MLTTEILYVKIFTPLVKIFKSFEYIIREVLILDDEYKLEDPQWNYYETNYEIILMDSYSPRIIETIKNNPDFHDVISRYIYRKR